ncbi:MAG: GPR endopeptidase [Ruminococcaceae bacterium]|nr:GPR endopeptidase [Oscillospiraceae bacterium]
MPNFRTDLALESALQLGIAGKNAQRSEGVRVLEYLQEGYPVTFVTVENEEGRRAIGRNIGRYITLDLQPYFLRQTHYFPRGVRCFAQHLRQLLPPLRADSCVLVAGLGNRFMACDAVGPMVIDNLLVTRHMGDPFQPVAAIATGVAGQSGMEAADLICGAAAQISPAAIIVVDALCARSRNRLCATIQLSDTGLTPGSGVGNHRRPIDQKAMGVPVLAIGIPTVIGGAVLAEELTGTSAKPDHTLFVTPRDVDSRVRELGRLVGYGISSALQPQLTVEDITGLLG